MGILGPARPDQDDLLERILRERAALGLTVAL